MIGAGDYIGAEISKKFAAGDFTVFVGWRNGDKLAPLGKEIEAAGALLFPRSLDARKEDEVVVSFLAAADHHAQLEVFVFNIGASVNFPSTTIRENLMPHHTIATAQARARLSLIEVPPTSLTNSPTTPARPSCGVTLNFANAPLVNMNCATHKGTSTDIRPLVCAVKAMLLAV